MNADKAQQEIDITNALQELADLESAKGSGSDQIIRCKAITLLRLFEGDHDVMVKDTEWFRRYVVAKGLDKGLELESRG
jgi:hypothetical protein